MGIQTPAAYLISPRLRNYSATVNRQQRPQNHYRPPQTDCLFIKIFRFKISKINVRSLKNKFAVSRMFNLYTHALKQFYQLHNVKNLRNIGNHYLFLGQQASTNHLKSLIFSTLRTKFSFQSPPAGNYKSTHNFTRHQITSRQKSPFFIIIHLLINILHPALFPSPNVFQNYKKRIHYKNNSSQILA